VIGVERDTGGGEEMSWDELEDRWDTLEAQARTILREIEEERCSILEDEEKLNDAYLDFELEE
jgi:hypothetical protein